jgi:hypothetical protein
MYVIGCFHQNECVYVGVYENLYRCKKVLTRVPSTKSKIGQFVLAGNEVEVRSFGWHNEIEAARQHARDLKDQYQPRLNVYGTAKQKASRITAAKESSSGDC